MIGLGIVALGLVAALTLTGVQAGATQLATMSVSPSSGPVGTVVDLSGNAGSNCTGAQFLNFGEGAAGPAEFIEVPVSSDGIWSATFVVPPFVGGAATRGGYGADVTAGEWQFEGPTCSGSSGAVPSRSFLVTGTAAAQPATRFAGMAPTPTGDGYWLTQNGGGVYAFGAAPFLGSLPAGPGGLGIVPAAPIAGIAATPDGAGYWLVGQDGGVYAFGDASFYGSLPSIGVSPAGAIVDITATPDGKGYWLLGADGGVYAFGDAIFSGASVTGVAVTSLVATPSGRGYLAIPANGDQPLADGDAKVPNSSGPGPMTLSALVTGGAGTPSGQGVWEVSSDGGVFSLGDAVFHGSLPGVGLDPAAPIVEMAATSDGGGYWLLGADGGVFAFGDAGFLGSASGMGLPW